MTNSKLILILFFMTGPGIIHSQAQQGVVSTGGEATGAGGSVQRSTGLTDFRYYFSQDGSVQYGIQQSYQLFYLSLFATPAAGGSVEAEGNYIAGQEVSLSAIPGEGYEFINWSDEDNFFVIGEASFDYIMPTQNVAFTANFNDLNDELPVYSTLFITLNNHHLGSILPAEGFYKLMPGQQITLTATPMEGVIFINWTDGEGNVVSKDPAFVYTLSKGSNTLRANFGNPMAVPLNGYAAILLMILAMGLIIIHGNKIA